MARRIFDPEVHCGGEVRQGPNKGGRCTQYKGAGTQHKGYGCCKLHGGNSPNHITKAKREMAEDSVVAYGLPRKIEPQQALLEEIWRTAGAVDFIEGKIREHHPHEALVFGTTAVEGPMAADGKALPNWEKQEAKPSVWLALYYKERQHLVDVCKVAIAAGIAERQVRLAESQGKLIAEVLRGTLADLGVEDDEKVAKALRKHLTLVSGGKKDDEG